ncbi:MAG: hypothetical protein Q8M66_05150, partial [Actinomycetota bacterium]|nr:hypothetical protein [Actinomycetota bacterium]
MGTAVWKSVRRCCGALTTFGLLVVLLFALMGCASPSEAPVDAKAVRMAVSEECLSALALLAEERDTFASYELDVT